MRLERLSLEHVRGLDHAEVRFAPHGVTVITAPNEAGKSTLFDALDVLLYEKHTTTKAHVRALQPAGRDVASTISATFTLGPHRVTVTKRFHRDRATEVAVEGPSPWQERGNEAHDRLQELLGAHTDLALLEALRFRQGRPLDALTLAGAPSIARALDAGAGGSGEPDDDVLYERIVEEYRRYHTARSGQEAAVLSDAAAAATAARDEVAELRAKEEELAADVDRARSIAAERRRLDDRAAQLAPRLAQRRDAARQVSELRGELATAAAVRARADQDAQQATAAVEERQALIRAVDARTDELAEAEAVLDARTQDRAPLAARADELEAAVATAGQEVRQTRQDLEAARTAAELAHVRAEVSRLADRQRRIDEAVEEAEAAERFLARTAWTSERERQLQDALQAHRLAAAQLDDAAPQITVLAQRELSVRTGDEPHPLAAGQRFSEAIHADTTLELVGIAEVSVTAGRSHDERTAALQRAEAAVSAACEELGVDDPEAAAALADEVRRAEQAIERRDDRVLRELDGGSRDQLRDELRGLRDREAVLVERLASDEPQLELAAPPGPQELDRLEERQRHAAARLAELEEELRVQRGAVEEATAGVVAARATRDAAASARRAAHDELARVRAAVPDDASDQRAEQAGIAAASAAAEVDRIEEQLRGLDADTVEALVGTAEAEVDAVEKQRTALQTEAAGLTARIQVVGGQGIGEARQAAEAELERRERDLRSLRRRAAAARALKEAVDRAREEAYAAYRAPLRERIVGAGRLVFGEDLDVELDEDLRVVARHAGGVWLPFDQLSAGAREQLAIVTALAAADLAGEDGVPLVLDDTLGYSDPDRLELLGAVLGRVAGPQVVALTCVPGRFDAIPGAQVVRLDDG